MTIDEQNNRTKQQLEDELVKRIERSQFIIAGLKKHEPFKALLKDFEIQVARIDSAWHLVMEPAKLNEFRITKLAAVSLVNALDNYEHDLHKATEELALLQNPESFVQKDMDNE